MAMSDLPLLSVLLLTYLMGAGLIWLVPERLPPRNLALGVSGLGILLCLLIMVGFDSGTAGFQWQERREWIPTLNIHYALGVDGISVLFLPATVLLFLGVILASWNSARPMPRLYFRLLLLQAGATLGIFMATDTLLFFLFWELSLVPFYFLASLWGAGPLRSYAATKYTLVMLGSGIPLLFGFIVLAFNHAYLSGAGLPGGLSFDLQTLLRTPMPDDAERLVFILLLLGFAAKIPAYPLHTWLPLLAMEGPVAIAAVLTGLKLGAYGLIRFAAPLAPGAAQELDWLLVGLGVIGLLYGAVAALAQTNLRAMLAYASLSHVGLVLLGIATFGLQGIQGAVMMLLNFSLVAGGLFLLTAFLRQRVGSTDITALGGAARTMPLLAGFTLFFGLAGMGMPLTSTFPAEFLILAASLQAHPGPGLAVLFAMILAGAYFLDLYRRAFLGPVSREAVAQAQDLRPRELWIMLMFAALVLMLGLFPSLVLEFIQPACAAWAGRFQ